MIGVAAINKLGYVGLNNSLPWKCSADMKFFKELTTGGTVVMGRKTWDSLPKKPLPNRKNLVLTGGNFETILKEAQTESPAFILGGSQAWTLFFPWIDTFFISRISDETEGDVKFPIDLESLYKKISVQSKSDTKSDFILEVWVKRGGHEKVN
jgi:dihydrofolate reductase